MLDDWDPAIRRYPDSVLDSGVKTIVQMGLLNRSVCAPPGGFKVTPDGGNITPDVISDNPKSPDLFALACYRTTKLFLDSKPSETVWGTRAFRSKTGNYFRYLQELEAEIHTLENGAAMFEGYQSYWSWMNGISGLPLGEILAQFKLGSPLWSATFTRDGMRVA